MTKHPQWIEERTPLSGHSQAKSAVQVRAVNVSDQTKHDVSQLLLADKRITGEEYVVASIMVGTPLSRSDELWFRRNVDLISVHMQEALVSGHKNVFVECHEKLSAESLG